MRIRGYLFIMPVFAVATLTVGFFSWTTSSEEETLFTVTRSFDDDIIKYDLRLDDQGNMDEDDPIHPYWVRYSEGGIIKELNSMQRKFAYGLDYEKLEKDVYKFNFVSYDKIDLYLTKSSENKYYVLTKIEDQFVIIKEIFLQVEKNGTIFNLPKLTWLDLKWYSPKDKKYGETRIDPND